MASKINTIGGSILGAFALWAGYLWLTSPNDNKTSSVQTSEAAVVAPIPSAPASPVGFDDPDHWSKNREVPDAACSKSLPCWSDKHQSMAMVLCKESVESQTKYHVKWTDGMFHPFFSRVKWGEMPGDIGHDVVYIGDELEVQNQYGAYEKMSYACPYNPGIDKSVTAMLYAGKLPAN